MHAPNLIEFGFGIWALGFGVDSPQSAGGIIKIIGAVVIIVFSFVG